MKSICIKEPGEILEIEVDTPKAQDSKALIKVHAAGICGSDLGAFRGTNNLVSYPRIIGHEIAGEIIAIDSNNPKNFKVGDRVVVDPYLYCGNCYPCSINRTNCCEDLKVIGVHVDGGMGEYYLHPDSMLTKIPEGLSYESAVLSEPLTISLHGLHRAKLTKGEHIVISGAGPIGILAAIVAKHYGAVPIVIDIVQERLDMVKDMGIEYTINSLKENAVEKIKEYCNGRLAEVLMEASGSNIAIKNSFDFVCNAGRVVLTGWPKNETSIQTGIFTKKELDIRGSRTSAGEFEEALDLINKGIIPLDKIITKVIPLEQAANTVRDIDKNPGDYLKVIVKL
jgi:2-desacetyl-2-hydroxyethyl bacteriochlorophyllide A dehydrogenase